MNESYQHLLSRYPWRKGKSRARLLLDREFREICDAYEDALTAYERWSASSHRESRMRAAEYEQIGRALEVEIAQLLHECD